MAWTIKFSKAADKALRKLDKSISSKIITALEKISMLENPHSCGKALQYNLGGLWRYRVGDYRIICHIENDELIILVVDVEHRSKIY